MASPTVSDPRNRGPQPQPQQGQVVQCSEYVEGQLRRAREQVRSVEFAGEILQLGALALGYLLALVIVDHWIWPGGLGPWGRTLAFLALLAGAAAYVVRRVIPLLIYKVNPVYAASVIEKQEPTLKNSLINFLLLRRDQRLVTAPVMAEIERKAATDLSSLSVDNAVDRSRVIRIGYVLLGLVAFACVYKLASPKDPLQSLGRVMFP